MTCEKCIYVYIIVIKTNGLEAYCNNLLCAFLFKMCGDIDNMIKVNPNPDKNGALESTESVLRPVE